jgi:hypothetical protein
VQVQEYATLAPREALFESKMSFDSAFGSQPKMPSRKLHNQQKNIKVVVKRSIKKQNGKPRDI